ncbi:MAG: type II toxin-antitoxin system VapC family toxin [Blastocatellales bacterium]
MTDILLDTDILIDLLRGYAQARVYFKQIEAGVIAAAVSAITVVELASGKMSGQNEEARVRNLLGLLEILDLDFDTAWRAGEIRRRHQTPFADAVIAATAIQQGFPLATKNLRHFQLITGLTTQQPYS